MEYVDWSNRHNRLSPSELAKARFSQPPAAAPMGQSALNSHAPSYSTIKPASPKYLRNRLKHITEHKYQPEGPNLAEVLSGNRLNATKDPMSAGA